MDKNKVQRIIGTEKIARTDGTWAQCTKVGNILFISGQVALDAQGNVVGKNDFETQAKKVLDNLVEVIKAGGAEIKDLMMINVFVTNMNNRSIFTKVRDAYFRENPPASTMVEISRLVMDDLLLEINGIAIIEG